MHIEPGVVEGAKIALSVLTAAGAVAYAAKVSLSTVKHDGIAQLAARSLITTFLVFCFFQVLPHYPVGVSEVHFILGATLFLIFGAGPAAIGLAMGLLLQGVLFAPADLPQYGINVTTLLVPLLLVDTIARRLIPAKTAYKDVKYRQALALSTAYQGGVVAWVAFWAFYGQGFGAENIAAVSSFSVAYMIVVVVEPLLDVAILAVAKSLHQLKENKLFHSRLYHSAA
ncbi:MAG: energy-coupling factor ABC transporter permease [Candidatus Thiodiazotropha sp. (ex Ctena orbiculata)]|nr:energy-coupling factor ABC transporter permease [Candidatus Thiodiazotropha taylori]PUB89467.1 MAG: cobalt transporter [gamma proteobacterium symbiont of Ctena orbiculata]MBT2995125.1 energy-coupling factor ABC transporter permease [Candidatus Thiodiazotropha taylori]MBT2999956.1 energy-coupling factor ABC transporter permease [Candidatus Thiodiazotropha taylori]MBT3027967.1 energy-coupling factor ABC transporter permease [Candidatus Thiodiazotropha taylori]